MQIVKSKRYCVMLGKVEIFNNRNVNLKFTAIVEADESEKDLYYEEGIEVVHPNIANIKKLALSIKENVSELKDSDLIGDLHTHPMTRGNNLDKNVDASTPSKEDVKSIIMEYEKGNLSPEKPFIFGIAGRRIGEEDSTYGFYQLIKRGDKYAVREIY